jgi:hypothetical protein
VAWQRITRGISGPRGSAQPKLLAHIAAPGEAANEGGRHERKTSMLEIATYRLVGLAAIVLTAFYFAWR